MTPPEAEHVRVECDARVATVQMWGTGARNVLTDSVLTSLATVLTELAADDDVWVVVVRGRDGSLCADPRPASQQDPPPRVADGGALAERILTRRLTGEPDPLAVIRRFAKPLICALEGAVEGRSLALALCADIRVAGVSATVRCPEVIHGSIPAPTTTALLSRLIGPARTNDMVLTGRGLDADAMAASGLVSIVTADDEVAVECDTLARAMASSAPLAMRFAKEAIVAGADIGLEAAVTLELDLSLILQLSRDRSEGLRAFLERRAPNYEGR